MESCVMGLANQWSVICHGQLLIYKQFYGYLGYYFSLETKKMPCLISVTHWKIIKLCYFQKQKKEEKTWMGLFYWTGITCPLLVLSRKTNYSNVYSPSGPSPNERTGKKKKGHHCVEVPDHCTIPVSPNDNASYSSFWQYQGTISLKLCFDRKLHR